MQGIESITTGRIQRLAQSKCLLGEPDIISIKQVKISTSLFSKEKKVEDLQENYINGLIFPTTAHFSSFISSRYKVKDPNKHTIKAKLFMFDTYGERDIQIEISIPGSMEARAFNLRGQPMKFNPMDYQRAYYSSLLRSFYPMNYPGIVLYPLMNRVQILKPIIRNFIVFSFQHEIREMNYELQIHRRRGQGQQRNLSLQIVISYLLQNNYSNLLKVVLEELRKEKSPRYGELLIEWKLRQRKFGDVIYQAAEKLLIHGHVSSLKQYQIRALFEVKKYSEVAFVGRSLIESGGTTADILNLLLHSLIELGEDQRYLKTLNLIYNLHHIDQKKWKNVSHMDCNHDILKCQTLGIKQKCLSEHSDLCFPFDNLFLNRLEVYQNQKTMLQKNSKQGFTLSVLQRVEDNLKVIPSYYQSLALYVKLKGWSSLVRYRAESFWLESDFMAQEEQIKGYNADNQDDRYSFFQQNYEKSQNQLQQQDFEAPQPQDLQEKHQQQPKQTQSQKQQRQESQQDDYDGKLSQHQSPSKIKNLPKCSARVLTSRKLNKGERSVGAKVQCNTILEQSFFVLFNDLKLQHSLQNWEQKLDGSDSSTFNKSKRDIAGIILLKKGFLHQKLLQNKKCQEAFQRARNISQSAELKLVANYQLILLYIKNKKVSGVQHYLVQLMRILKQLGVDNFDIVPEWAKPIMQFVMHQEGLSTIRNFHPVFKQVFGFYLRSNWSDLEVHQHLQFKK